MDSRLRGNDGLESLCPVYAARVITVRRIKKATAFAVAFNRSATSLNQFGAMLPRGAPGGGPLGSALALASFVFSSNTVTASLAAL
jgi:hypothetical protein